jgi:tetratricopeptide (TPR) repeat protein
VILAAAGCARKQVRTGMPFDLGKVFTGLPAPTKETWKDKGIRLAKEKQFDQAIQAFMEHVVEEPEDFFGFNGLAVCYKNIGDHANAMKNYERALEFADSQEDKAKVLANIGNLYFATDKPQAALGYYKEAATEFDKNPLYLVFIARTFVILNDYDRAKKVLASAEEMHKNLEKYERDEDKGLGSYLMAYCYLALNEEDKVFQHLENALKANAAKYISRIESDVSDEKSLLYTLKEDPRLKKLLKKYSAFSEATKSDRDLDYERLTVYS